MNGLFWLSSILRHFAEKVAFQRKAKWEEVFAFKSCCNEADVLIEEVRHSA